MPEPLMADPPPAPGRVAKRQERRRGLLLGVTPRAALGWIAAAAVVVATLGALFAFLATGRRSTPSGRRSGGPSSPWGRSATGT